MEHTSSMPLRAARVGQQRLLGKGSHKTKALSHAHKHTLHIHTHRSVYADTVSYATAQAFSCTHLPEAATTHILTHRPCTLVAGQALHTKPACFLNPALRPRPYHMDCTGSRSTSEVERRTSTRVGGTIQELTVCREKPLPWRGVHCMLLHVTNDNIESYTAKDLRDAS
jgi:hypothetical protein